MFFSNYRLDEASPRMTIASRNQLNREALCKAIGIGGVAPHLAVVLRAEGPRDGDEIGRAHV